MIYLILVFGLILRLISLNQSLWLDEATSALVAKMPLSDIFTKFLPGDFHPPLYYLVLKYWTDIFGYSEISLRIPSIIFGLLTIYFIYKIVLLITVHGSQFTAKLAAFLLTTSGLAIYYSQEARMYMMATFLVALAFYLFLKKKWVLFSITLAAIGMTDYVSLLVVPVFWFVAWKARKKLVFAHFPLLAVFAVWASTFIKQLTGGLSQSGSAWWNILGTASFKNAVLIPIKFIVGRISFDNKFFYTAIALGVSIVFGYALVRSIRLIRSINNLKLIWYWLTLPIVLGIILSFKIPTLSYFRFLFCLPAFYILVSFGIERIGKYKTLLIGLILAVNILSSGYYLFNPRFQREDWRVAARTIGSDQIVLPGDSQSEALVYYGKGDQITKFPTGGSIWLSRYVWEIVDPMDTTRLKVENLGYNKAGEYDFNGVVFWKYTKNLYASRY